MAEVSEMWATYDPKSICPMDQTRLQNRCLRNRSYIAVGRPRRVRVSKAMTEIDLLALILA